MTSLRIVTRFIFRAMPWIVALLCIPGFMVWALGVPGQPTPRTTTALMTGFFSIALYLLVIVVLSLVALVSKMFGIARGRVTIPRLAGIALAIFLAAQAFAFTLMLA